MIEFTLNSTFQLINRSHLNRTSFVHYIIHFFFVLLNCAMWDNNWYFGRKKNGISTYQFFGLCLYIFIFMYCILYGSTRIEFDCLHELFQHDFYRNWECKINLILVSWKIFIDGTFWHKSFLMSNLLVLLLGLLTIFFTQKQKC